MEKFQLSLTENAFDFFLEGIEQLSTGKPRGLKYAVLHSASAIELVLKARLSQEHWTLLFKDPSQASPEKFKTGKFRSIDFQEALECIEGICTIDLSKYKPLLKTIRDTRNRIQHFGFSAKVPEVTSLLIKTWSFLWDFIHDQMPDEIENEREILEKIKESMVRHEKYVGERLKEIEPILNSKKREGVIVIGCPSCFQETLTIPGGENPLCDFCRYECDPELVADDWATVFIGYPHTDPKERMIEPVLKECQSCGVETMIEFEDGDMTPPDPAWFCFSCGGSGSPMVTCLSCGEEFPWEGEIYVCSECREKGITDDQYFSQTN